MDIIDQKLDLLIKGFLPVLCSDPDFDNGVLASGIMTFFEYKRFGIPGNDLPSFESWLESIYKDSYASWALAASMIATGTAAKRSPVVTGLIIAAFSLYGVLDGVRPIAKKYNFAI